MKILILYAKIGNGHYKAAEAIKENLEKKYPSAEIVFEDGLKYSSVITNQIAVKGYTSLIKYIPSMWGAIYYKADSQDKNALNDLSNLIHKGLTIKLKKLLRQTHPDVVVSTHPFVTKTCAYLKKKGKTRASIVSVMTDYAVHNAWIEDHKYLDKILVATEEMKHDCLDYGIEDSKVCVTGIPISGRFLETFDKNETLKEYGLSNEPVALFFAGGGLGLGKSDEIFENLLKVNENMQIVAVCGKNEKQKERFEDIANEYSKKVIILGYTNDVPRLMNMCDFVISKPGGLTSTECLVSNKPLLIINPIPGQEDQNAIYFSNNGTALRAYDDQPIAHQISTLVNNKERVEQIKEMCKKIAKPNAADTITRIILDEYNKETK